MIVDYCQSLLFKRQTRNPSESLSTKCAWCIRLHLVYNAIEVSDKVLLHTLILSNHFLLSI